MNDNNIIIEMIAMQGAIKVSAIDPATGTEASIVGDPKATEQELKDLAVKKLMYVLEKGEK